MNNCLMRDCLERVALVTRRWADEPTYSASLRHMSLYVHQLAIEVGRRKVLCSTAVRNVESRFCLMCQRLKAGSEAGDCPRSLEHCQLLKNADSSILRQRIVNLGLLDPPTKTATDTREMTASQ
jgi:hypothetical protein